MTSTSCTTLYTTHYMQPSRCWAAKRAREAQAEAEAGVLAAGQPWLELLGAGAHWAQSLSCRSPHVPRWPLLAAINIQSSPGGTSPTTRQDKALPRYDDSSGRQLGDRGQGSPPAGGRAADKANVPAICAGCGRALQPHDAAAPGGMLECLGCRRCFHGRCHRRWAASRGGRKGGDGRGRAGRDEQSATGPGAESEEGVWFHDGECRQVHQVLARLCRKGDLPCPSAPALLRRTQHHHAGSHVLVGVDQSKDTASTSTSISSSSSSSSGSGGSKCTDASSAVRDAGASREGQDPDQYQEGEPLRLRLYDCRAGGMTTATGLRRVHAVMSQHFGYGLADYRLFDYAALLHRGPTVISAALIDVYGADLAELYLAATCTAWQRRGYGSVMVRELEAQLCEAGVRQLVVSVDDDDTVNQELWRSKFGFQPLASTELAALGRQWGEFGAGAAAGAVFLGRRLLP